MNEKQITDLIERMRELGHIYSYQGAKILIREYEKLNKPEKVQIPQIVADWIEVCKEHLTTSLYTAMNPSFMRENNQSFDLVLWIKKTSNQETFARAWLDGYEVEEEKRYIVKIKNLDSDVRVLKKRNRWYFGGDWDDARDTGLKIHTRKELEEAGFGWVFDCQGIKIEEAE